MAEATEPRIPPEFHSGLRKLMGLSEEAVDRLISVLNEAAPISNEKGLVQAIVPKMPEIPADDIKSVIETVINLRAVVRYFEISADAFARDLCVAISKGGVEGLNEYSSDVCFNRLKRFFDNEALEIPSRITKIMRDHKYLFCEARILTDIRPIFADVEQEPTAAVIVHMLKLHYHEGDAKKDFYLAMDSSDIQDLRKVLDRAEAKAKSLKSVLEKAKIPYIDVY